VPQIEVITELEHGRGWEYRVAAERDSGERTEHTVRLSWVDHEHWSGGRTAPSRVVQVLMELLLEREREQRIPDKFDASTMRRLHPELDGQMQSRV
jgi:hypothetical protein